MNDTEFIALVTQRIEQRPQGVRFPADTVFAIRDTALDRLADSVAADPVSYTLLQRAYALTLVAGEVTLLGLTPTLLLSKEGRMNWHVTMTGNDFPLINVPHRRDFGNLPPTPDYRFYNLLGGTFAVRTFDNQIPAETAVTLYGNCVPLISDAAITSSGYLKTSLIDIAVTALLETMMPKEKPRSSERVNAVEPTA